MSFRPCSDVPGISPMYKVSFCEESDTVIRLHAEVLASTHDCPFCRSREVGAWGQRSVTLLDMPRRGKRVEIVATARRLRCKNKGVCGKLFQQPLPDTSEHHNMTKRLRRWIGEQGRIRTFVAIARDLQIAEATVRQVFGDCIREIESAMRILPPTVLALVNVQVHQACRVAAVNAELGTLVGLVDKDEAAALSGYLAEIYDRHKVGFVSLGPSGPALAAVELVLPDAVPFLDKPHVLGMVDRAVRGVRRTVRRDVTRQVRDKHLLDDGLILEQRLRDLSGEHLSALEMWRASFPALSDALEAAEGVRRIYDTDAGIRDGSDAADALAAAVGGLGGLCATHFQPLVSTLRAWRGPWSNYFTHAGARAGGLERLDDIQAIGTVLEELGRSHAFGAVRANLLLPPALPARSFSSRGVSISRLVAGAGVV